MKNLIDDILKFLRLSYENSKPEIIDLNKILTETVNLLKKDYKDKTFHVQFSGLPSIYVDGNHFRILFYNLLSYLIKLSESDFCKIYVNCILNNEKLLFTISDNTIDIDSTDLQKVFNIFQKIQNKEDLSGKGIGLAICRKIVEIYNGELRIDPKPGNGTTLNFIIQHNGKYSTN
jgi:light-regulated signal transduction histidine kinase (bacteriophytochrome)